MLRLWSKVGHKCDSRGMAVQVSYIRELQHWSVDKPIQLRLLQETDEAQEDGSKEVQGACGVCRGSARCMRGMRGALELLIIAYGITPRVHTYPCARARNTAPNVSTQACVGAQTIALCTSMRLQEMLPIPSHPSAPAGTHASPIIQLPRLRRGVHRRARGQAAPCLCGCPLPDR